MTTDNITPRLANTVLSVVLFLNMKNILTPADINWKFGKHLGGSTIFRDEKFKIQWEQHASGTDYGKSYPAKNYFFIDKYEKEYRSVEELCDAWNDMYEFEVSNPDFEIEYIKVYKKKGQKSKNAFQPTKTELLSYIKLEYPQLNSEDLSEIFGKNDR